MRYILAVLLLSACVSAQTVSVDKEDSNNIWASGNQFLALCEGPLATKPLNTTAAECLIFTIGLGEGVSMFADRGGPKEMFCTPAGVTQGQQTRILVKFIKDHPQSAHEETRLLLLEALVDAFPCPAKVKP